MKIFLLAIIILCCYLIGNKVKNYYSKRQKFYENFCLFCENLVNEISSTNKKMVIIVDEQFLNFKNDFKLFLKIYSKFLTLKIDKKQFIYELMNQFEYLKQEEINQITSFLISIGGFTKDEELKNINSIKNKLITKYDEAKDFNKKYANLYFKLFIILGLFLFIVFI